MKRALVGLTISLLLLAVSFTAYSLQTHQTVPTRATAQYIPINPEPVKPIVNISVHGLFTKVNEQRTANGLPIFILDERLNNSAKAKCNDMVAKNYWAHNAPDGQTPWHFFTEAGFKYRVAAENLGKHYSTTQSVVTGWMGSEGHRLNIVNPDYTYVGYAVCESEDYIGGGFSSVIVQHLASK